MSVISTARIRLPNPKLTAKKTKLASSHLRGWFFIAGHWLRRNKAGPSSIRKKEAQGYPVGVKGRIQLPYIWDNIIKQH
jgi:hypothetical protein